MSDSWDVIPSGWKDVEKILMKFLEWTDDLPGNFTDAPMEKTKYIEKAWEQFEAIEASAENGIKTWIMTGRLLPLLPAANRLIRVKFLCTLGYVKNMGSLPGVDTPHGWTIRDILEWLLLYLAEDTTQVALDHMRMDILGVQEYPYNPYEDS